MKKPRPGSPQPSRQSAPARHSKASTASLLYIPEPTLTFGLDQRVEDPRDGLLLFGPLDQGRPFGIRVAVIGTDVGINLYRDWAQRIQGNLRDRGSQIARPPFPGFHTVFRVPWAIDPVLTVRVPRVEIERDVRVADGHVRVYKAVSLYADRILNALNREEAGIDLWFVVIPDIVHKNCRPKSRIPLHLQIEAEQHLGPRFGRRLINEPSMFGADNVAAIPYRFEVDFHNQLKARLLGRGPTQIVRESTLELISGHIRPKHDSLPFQAAIAWNICSAAFYKSGGRPWKAAGIRDGVCYVGLVFKRDERHLDPSYACCAAQMFLDSGDGLVFRGAVGPWYSDQTREYHLKRAAARQLGEMVIAAYREKHNGQAPTELFIHGRAFFDDEEWLGFSDAVAGTSSQLVGIRIRDESAFRLYRLGERAVLRGSAVVLHEKAAYLMTRGHVPRLRTQVGLEVPRPLRVDIVRGEADIRVVLTDILSLTKLNYNACIFADGLPVTLRFADDVGEILTAGPVIGEKPLPFKHYI
jgi:hypothetical protein